MMIKNTLLSITAVLGILGMMAPAHADNERNKGSWQRADPGRHQYVYYPAQQIYFSPANNTWFWLNGGNWQVGATLPARHRLNRGDGVQVVLQSGRPYTQHVYVEEKYGRPWRARHRDPVRHVHRDAGKQHKHAHKHDHQYDHRHDRHGGFHQQVKYDKHAGHDQHNFQRMRQDVRTPGRRGERD